MRRILALVLCLAAAPLRAEQITVFAASSLVDALGEAAEAWEAETGHTVLMSFAATSTLAAQIERGAPADIFVAADAEWMDAVEVRVAERVDLLGNTLVVIAHGAGLAETGPVTAETFAGLGDGPLAMALTETVPAGRYGRAALKTLGLWAGMPVAEAANVRAALAFVATGAAPMGVVYGSDAAASGEVRIVGTFDPALHPPITYPAAVLEGGAGDPATTRAFFDWLQSDAADAIFAAYGFTPK